MRTMIIALFLMFLRGAASAASSDYSEQECKFTVAPYSVCSISFYRLLAAPEKFDAKYIAVVGFFGIDNGRIAIFPAEMSYDLGIQQESFTISAGLERRIDLAEKYAGKYVRIVGKFHFKIVGDKPGIGFIRDVVDIFTVEPRKQGPESQVITGTAEELSRLGSKPNPGVQKSQ